ncbi:hypothetical protein [Streptomyces sp. NPDC001980]|uniref:hypothetical protein n=1 Tax=Streptomyces sp. NPDC001980 TaxID=3157126 RepID=UPI00331A741D
MIEPQWLTYELRAGAMCAMGLGVTFVAGDIQFADGHVQVPEGVTEALKAPRGTRCYHQVAHRLPGVLIEVVRRRPTIRPVKRDISLDTLTGRGCDVLTAVASGQPMPTTSPNSCPAPRTTVKSHVRHIHAEIGIRARVQAVAFAYESGLVPVAEEPAAGPCEPVSAEPRRRSTSNGAVARVALEVTLDGCDERVHLPYDLSCSNTSSSY